jgi:hypothetical protein
LWRQFGGKDFCGLPKVRRCRAELEIRRNQEESEEPIDLGDREKFIEAYFLAIALRSYHLRSFFTS